MEQPVLDRISSSISFALESVNSLDSLDLFIGKSTDEGAELGVARRMPELSQWSVSD
jgi:hypothetical protein